MRKVIENRDTTLKLPAKIQELQNEVQIEDDGEKKYRARLTI